MNKTRTKILILCTGNSCRSQMAHGFLQSFSRDILVCSAGTRATGKISSKAIDVMNEAGIDIRQHSSDQVDKYLSEEWDYVITVCNRAKENCPVFTGKVKHRIHIGFDDPSEARGSNEYIMGEFRRVRDEIKEKLYTFFLENLSDISV